jgi:hypothetical protein
VDSAACKSLSYRHGSTPSAQATKPRAPSWPEAGCGGLSVVFILDFIIPFLVVAPFRYFQVRFLSCIPKWAVTFSLRATVTLKNFELMCVTLLDQSQVKKPFWTRAYYCSYSTSSSLQSTRGIQSPEPFTAIRTCLDDSVTVTTVLPLPTGSLDSARANAE